MLDFARWLFKLPEDQEMANGSVGRARKRARSTRGIRRGTRRGIRRRSDARRGTSNERRGNVEQIHPISADLKRFK